MIAENIIIKILVKSIAVTHDDGLLINQRIIPNQLIEIGFNKVYDVLVNTLKVTAKSLKKLA